MSDADKNDTPMWKFQGWFQRGATKAAEKVFNRLDDKLRPRVFLIGIPEAATEESVPVCLEPVDECGYQSEFFSGVMGLARQIEEEEAAKTLTRRQPEEGQERKVSAKSLQRAVERTLNESAEGAGVVSYCSPPTTVGGFKVCCVLQFDAAAFIKHFTLPEEWIQSTRIARSLIDATAVEFLKVCARGLRDPKAGLDLDTLGVEAEEILPKGGRELMRRVHGGAPGAFEALNSLSWKTHEGELAGGEIYFFHWDDYHLEMLVEFKHPPELKNLEAARKAIEMAKAKKLAQAGGEELYLISGGHWIQGIGRLKELEDEYDRYWDIFIAKFTGYYRWELRHREGGVMMQVINGVPSLPGDPVGEEKFRDHMRRRFAKSSPDEDALWDIVRNAVKQTHGTMIVISSAAAEEADRLEEQSTVLKDPVPLNEANLLMLSSIDGAVLVDPAGVCHAAGVILDGTAVKGKGTSSRGARYNSAIRYNLAKEKESECLAVVISQDGTINLVPELHPRIRRSEITEHMKKLRATIAPEVVDAKEYYRALEWLSAHRFYLSRELGDEINEIKTATKERLEDQRGYSMTPADFEPNEEMNDTYFLDEAEQ